MGNVCGCVRAQKEEYYIDPAKAPFSPGKNSSGRRFFRRRKSDKRKEAENCDGAAAIQAASQSNEDGYISEDFFLGVTTKTSPVVQPSPKYVCSIRPTATDSLAQHCLNSSTVGQEVCLENIHFVVKRNLSFPNIPNKSTFLTNADACYEKKTHSLSAIDCLVSQEMTRTNSDDNGDREEERKSSDCLVYASYYHAAKVDRPSYVPTLTQVSREDMLSTSSPAVVQVNMTGLKKKNFVFFFTWDFVTGFVYTFRK